MSVLTGSEALALRAAAALALAVPPAAGAPGVPEGADPARVASVLRRNKVPLCHLRDAAVPEAWKEAVGWREAVSREAAEQEALRAELIPVCAALRESGIEPILFKSPGGTPYRSSNVDLLVRPSQFESAAAWLEDAGHLRMPHYREDHKRLFHRFRAGRPVISVHLHEAVSWGRVLVLGGDDVADGARLSPERFFSVASPSDLALATLAHALYETDEVRLIDLRLLRLCNASPGFVWEDVERRAQDAGWGFGFHAIVSLATSLEEHHARTSCVPAALRRRAAAAVKRSAWAGGPLSSSRDAARHGTPDLPWRFSKAWSKAHYLIRLMTQPTRAPDERLEDLMATAWNLAANRWHLRARPGSIIAVSGLDGAGKSTVVSDLDAVLRLCEVPVSRVWSRGGFSPGAGWLKRSARRALPRHVPPPGAHDRKAAWLARPVPAALFASFVVAEMGLRLLARVRIPRSLGRTIVCDRYVQDAAAELESRLGRGRAVARTAARLLPAWAPRPHLAVLLRLSAEEAVRRKPEEADRGELRRRAEALDRLAREQGMLVLDASRPLDEVRGEVVERALRLVFARFEGRSA